MVSHIRKIMKQLSEEYKHLLLKDLWTRVPFGVYAKVKRTMLDEKVEYIGKIGLEVDFSILQAFPYKDDIEILPYLRPMSSMTEEEEEEWWEFENKNTIVESHSYSVDWLNAHYFDYRGLIEKGLALEAPTDMYNNK